MIQLKHYFNIRLYTQLLLAILLLTPTFSNAQQNEREIEREREQDSLRNLLESGKGDTINYIYRKGSSISLATGKAKGFIEVTQRIDSVENNVGEESVGVSCILWGLTALMVYYFVRLAIAHVFKIESAHLLLYIIMYLIYGLIIYTILSGIYCKIDDVITRNSGASNQAAISIEWEQYWRSAGKGKSVRDYRAVYSFVFRDINGVLIAVKQGKSQFNIKSYPQWDSGNEGMTNKELVPVRYNREASKLSIGNNTYTLWNIYGIVWRGILLFLLFLMSYGRFNKIIGEIIKKLIPI